MPSATHSSATDHVKDVLQLADSLGVLSVYLSARDAATPGNAALQALEIELGRMARLVHTSWTTDTASAHAALDTIEQRVRGATLSGEARNLAFFAALGQGKTVAVEPVGSVPTRATLGPRADVRPLCVALAEARPAGVALISAAGVRVFEWQPGALAEIWSETFGELEEPDLIGPAHAHPRGLPGTAPGFKVGQQRDLFEQRIRSELERLLVRCAGEIAELARARDWHELALAGDDRLTAALSRGLPRGLPVEIAPVPRLEQWRSPGELAVLLAPAIAAVRERRTSQLVVKVLDEAGGSGHAVRGLQETLAALAEARVGTLLVAAEASITRRPPAEGSLAAPDDVAHGAGAAGHDDDSMPFDAMIAQALDTAASVVVLSPACARLLGDDDVAALLRY